MNKGSLTGWKDVFSFTLIQTLKSKAFMISYVILLVLTMVSMPIVRVITSAGMTDANAPNPVKKVYIDNKTRISNMDFSEVLKNKNLSHILFENLQEDFNAVSARIEAKEKESIMLTIQEDQGQYSLNFLKASSGPIKESSLKLVADPIAQQFEVIKMRVLGIKNDQLSVINAKVNTKVFMAKENSSISFSEYWFIYGILFIVMMSNVLASTQIASSIVTEKSTRVIEYLLTSVKPLAIIAGKIIAMLTAVLLQLITMVVILFLSNKVSAALVFSSGESILSQYLPKNIFQNLNIINLVFCIILIMLGMIFYAGLAGLAGATVSRIEELNEGLVLFTFTNMVSAYIGIGAAVVLMTKGINTVVLFAFLFPMSSPFILPGAILIGKAGLPLAVAAILLQILFIVLLFKFVAKVYETLILHNGNKIKIKELIKISKTV